MMTMIGSLCFSRWKSITASVSLWRPGKRYRKPLSYTSPVMLCPECGAEYRQGFYECSDCQVPLVHELPAQPEPEPADRVVPILEVGPVEFGRVRSILEEAGIECFAAQDDGLGAVLGTRLSSGVWVQVREQDAEPARRLLTGFLKSDWRSENHSGS